VDVTLGNFAVGADDAAFWVVPVCKVERSAVVGGNINYGRRCACVVERGGHRHQVIVAADEVSAALARGPLIDEDVPFPEFVAKASEGSLCRVLLGLLR
jgi:hypothetical protein